MAGPAYYAATMRISKNEDWIVGCKYGTPLSNGDFYPIDLTGSVLKLEIRRREPEHEAIVSVSSLDNGIIVNDPTNGYFTIWIVRAKLARLMPGEYVSDLVRSTPNFQERLWEGPALVVEGTTR